MVSGVLGNILVIRPGQGSYFSLWVRSSADASYIYLFPSLYGLRFCTTYQEQPWSLLSPPLWTVAAGTHPNCDESWANKQNEQSENSTRDHTCPCSVSCYRPGLSKDQQTHHLCAAAGQAPLATATCASSHSQLPSKFHCAPWKLKCCS